MSIIDYFLEAVDSEKGDQDVGADNILDENMERTEIKDAELHMKDELEDDLCIDIKDVSFTVMDNVDDELLKGHEVDEEDDDAEEKEGDDKESENASVSSSDSDAEADPEQQSADELSEEEKEALADAEVNSDISDPPEAGLIEQADLMVASLKSDGSSTEDTLDNV